ncbi:MAG: TetR/AcrR family transcriptional regulator [Clostridiales Family XIII bacterium]|jgi:AcrR family transcriptional regulator|nr:TetR/AcrR family transcriptional regulator [Clostridiales Family XIII bacterium]
MEEGRAQKKERIFEAAFETFLVNGYTNARMSEIAARAGLAKATLYEYFSSKEALFEELLHAKVIGPYLAFEERLDKKASCAARIRDFMRMEMDFLSDLTKGRELLPKLLLHAELMGNATIASAAHRIISFKFRVFRDLLREGMARGEFREADPFTVAACMIGAFNLFAACSCNATFLDLPFRFPESANPDETFFKVLFEGIVPPPSRSDGLRDPSL